MCELKQLQDGTQAHSWFFAVMSYEDLAFQGFSSSRRVIRRCLFCVEDVSMAASSFECPTCGRTLGGSVREEEAKAGPHNEVGGGGEAASDVPGGRMDMANWFGQFVPFMGGAGGGGPDANFLQMAQAQRGMSLETIMAGLLNSDSSRANPSSELFRKGLVEVPLKPTDFVQVLLFRFEG